MFIDARVPVVFGLVADAGPDDALLIEGDAPAPDGLVVARLADAPLAGHAALCVCCLPRSAAGSALASLFLARGRGDVAFFRRVIAVTDDPSAIRAALEDDILAASWFRIC